MAEEKQEKSPAVDAEDTETPKPDAENKEVPPVEKEKEKDVAMDDDGAKTVEAIAETVVSITVPSLYCLRHLASSMDFFGAARKRARPDAANGNSGFYRSKHSKEMESGQPGLGSKLKPCTKFFSTAGCPFDEGCHFLNYKPGGYNAVAQMTNLGNSALFSLSRNPMGSTSS